MANESDIPPQGETVTLPVYQESLHVDTRSADTFIVPVLEEVLVVEKRDKQPYSSTVNRGNTVLTVDAATDDEIDRASGIIEGFGPLDIDERQGLPGQAPPPRAYQGAAGSMPDLDTHFRSHWQSNYASAGGRYEDYDPAYRYGWSMAFDASYRGRPWNDVEPELRSDWESRHRQSAWDRFKAAIREGWDRMTS
ncbi:MAG: hypothetical protein ABIQ08_06305 [Duganella sp.]